MALHIIVTAKQVIDPEMPTSAFSIEATEPRVVTPATFQPVVNGFDEMRLANDDVGVIRRIDGDDVNRQGGCRQLTYLLGATCLGRSG